MADNAFFNSTFPQQYKLGIPFSIFAMISLVVMTNYTAGMTNALLSMVGIMIGVTLVLGKFGFTGGWSALINHRDGRGLRAQMLIIGLASAIFYPILANGSLFGSNVTGFISPIGIATIFGSFLFGIGMQFGGCCASGALSWAGAGSTRILLTLIGFIIGAVWGAYDIAFWRALPGVKINLTAEFGVAGGLGVTLFICAVVAIITLVIEKRRHGKILPYKSEKTKTQGWQRLVKGQWPILAVILLLVLANFLTLNLAGRPWGVTSAFVLWGSKFLSIISVDVTSWSHWKNPAALDRSILFDVTSVMNLGILFGSFTAAHLMGTFKLKLDISFKLILVSIIGGIMLGYGSRIAYGCNIGAFFSGISSASFSGWVWFVFAFAGNLVGTVARKQLSI